MKGSIIIVSFFAIGIAVGLFHLLPTDINSDEWSYYALCMLMFCVGISIGNDIETLKSFRRVGAKFLLLPIATIVGTLVGCAVVALLLPSRQLTSCLAIGSGFGYYSLSCIFITEMRGVELGTIALLANIMREIITLLGAPILRKWFGPLAPISAGGATTMDTTLPIITQVSGKQFTVISIAHGFITDFTVPFLVTLFCSI